MCTGDCFPGGSKNGSGVADAMGTCEGQLTLFHDRTPRSLMVQAIKDHYPDTKNGRFWYKHFTDLAYKYATGYSTQGLRRFVMSEIDRNVMDAMTQEERWKVQKAYRYIANAIYDGKSYEEIKQKLLKE